MMRMGILANISYPQVVVALALLGGTASAFTVQGMPVLYPFIQEEFGATRAQLGLITSGLVVGGTGTVLLMGWLADWLGVRKLLTVTIMMMAIGILLFSQIQSMTQGILLALMIGVAGSATAPASSKAIMDWVTPRVRGLSMGIKETSVPFSGITAAALLPILAVTFSWRGALLFLALTMAVTSVVFATFYRDRSTSRTQMKRSGLVTSIALVARNKNLWLTSLSRGSLQTLQVTFVAYLILFLIENLDMSEAVAASFLAIAWVGSAVGRIFWGLASDLLGGRRTVVLALVGMIAMLSMALMTQLPSDASPVVVAMLVSMVGASALAWAGLYDALIVELVGPGLTGTSIGFAGIVSRAAGVVPPLFGLVVDKTGSYDIGWWMLAGFASLSALLIAFVRHQPRDR